MYTKNFVAPIRPFCIVTPGLYKSMGGAWRISLLSASPYLLFNTVWHIQLTYILMHAQPFHTLSVLHLLWYMAFTILLSNLCLTQTKPCSLVLLVPPALPYTHAHTHIHVCVCINNTWQLRLLCSSNKRQLHEEQLHEGQLPKGQLHKGQLHKEQLHEETSWHQNNPTVT